MEEPIIIYEDNHIIVVLKPQNTPCCEDESKDKDLLTAIKDFIKLSISSLSKFTKAPVDLPIQFSC